MNTETVTTRSFKKKLIVLIGTIVGIAAVSTTAYAMWSSTGVGAGNAKARTAINVTVNASTGTADLYPGFTQGDVFFTLTNTNPYPITFTSMAPGSISSNTGGCNASLLSVASASGLSLTVGPNSTSAEQSIADVVTLDSTAPDACQGAVFTINMTLTGSQS